MSMTKKELYKTINEASDYMDKLSHDIDEAIWGGIQRNPELFDSMCKSEQIMLIGLNEYIAVLQSRLNTYQHLIAADYERRTGEN